MDFNTRNAKREQLEGSTLAKSARAAKKQTISQIASIGRKYKLLKYPILFFLVAFIFVYNFIYYFCLAVKMREKMARAVALGLSFVMVITSVDLTAFALSRDGNEENAVPTEYTRIVSDKVITSVQPFDDTILFQTVEPNASLQNIVLPDSINAHVEYQVETVTVIENSAGAVYEETQQEDVSAEAESNVEEITPDVTVQETESESIGEIESDAVEESTEIIEESEIVDDETAEVAENEEASVTEEDSFENVTNTENDSSETKDDLENAETIEDSEAENDEIDSEKEESEGNSDDAAADDSNDTDDFDLDADAEDVEPAHDFEEPENDVDENDDDADGLTDVPVSVSSTMPLEMSVYDVVSSNSPGESVEVVYTEEEVLEMIKNDNPEIVEYTDGNSENIENQVSITPDGDDSLVAEQPTTYQEITNVETVEEDVRLSVSWTIDEKQSSKPAFEEAEQGDVFVFIPSLNDSSYIFSEGVVINSITVSVASYPAFESSVTVDGITISVSADEGVLPKNATVRAESVNNLDKYIGAYTLESSDMFSGQLLEFDISIFDELGNEIEPDTSKGSVYVSFSNPATDGSYAATDWSVYHVDEETKTIEALDMEYNTIHGEIAAETDSFSSYIIEAKTPPAIGDARVFNLANGSPYINSSQGTAISLTGEGTNTQVHLINNSGKEVTFDVYLNEINCSQDNKKNNSIVIDTNGYKTNVYFYATGSNYFFSSSSKTIAKTGSGSANVYFDSLHSEKSYVSFQQSNLFNLTRPLDPNINFSLAPNGAYMSAASLNIFGSTNSFEEAVYGGKYDDFEVGFYFVGKVELYLDKNGMGFSDDGNIDGELVSANAEIHLPQPEHRRGYIFDGYQISRPYVYKVWTVSVSGGWTDYSAPDYKPGDVVRPEGENLRVAAHYTAIPNTVNIDLRRNGDKWAGQNVSLYLNNELKYSLSPKDGVYSNSTVINGIYNIYVNGEDSGCTVEVDCDKESIKVNQTVYYASADLTVKLDDTTTTSLGDIVLRKNGAEIYRIKSTTGLYSGSFSCVYYPLDIFLETIDTSFDLTDTQNGVVQDIDYYTMEITLADDAPWTNAYIALKDPNGITVAEPEFSKTNGNSTVYERIMQKNATPMGVYEVYVNDVDSGHSVAAVSTKRKSTVEYYSSKITMHTVLTEAEIIASNGINNINYEKDAETNATNKLLVYSADHILKRTDISGEEMSYELTIGSVVDTNTNLVSSIDKNKDFDLEEIRYHNSSNTSPTGEGTELDEIMKRQYVRKNGLIPKYNGGAARNSYTFGFWSQKKWSPKENVSSCPEYDYSTPVTADMDLYAVYLEPDVKIGDLVYTDVNGNIGGNGQYYRMGNLAISGFEKSEDAIGFIYLTVANTDKIILLNKNSIFNNLTVKNGSTAVNLGTGASISFAPNSFGDKIAILFKKPVSMAKAQDFLQNCVVVNPKANVEHTLEIMVTDAAGSYVAANAVSPVAAVNYTIPNKPVCIDGYSAGATLNSGTYYITANKTFSGTSVGNGLKIASSATVYIYIPKGVKLTATGKNGSGTTPGYAGIYLPSGSNLYILGEGTIAATGGKAGDNSTGALNGSDGGSGYSPSNKYMQAGNGGKGGSGGGGAGAGIGTNGAAGPAGGEGAGGVYCYFMNSYEPNWGGAGSTNFASASGNFYYDSKITISASGGSAGSSNGVGGSGGYFWADNGSGWKDGKSKGYCAVGAGGGGGGGGCGFAGADIGKGGSSGGSGGGGAGGGSYRNGKEPRYARNGGGGHGGVGGNSANGSDGGYCSGGNTWSGNNSENWNRGGSGGSGGSKGAEINRNVLGYNAVGGTISFDVSSSKTATGKYNAITYYYGKAKTITLPSYTNSDPHVHFLGWEVKQPAKNYTAGTMLTTANYRIMPGTNSVTLAEGTYGDIKLVAVVETFGGINDKDNIDALHYKYTASAATKTYSTYTVDLLLNGQKTTKGNIQIGTTSVSPSEDGSYKISVESSKAAASLAVLVDGKNVGNVAKNDTLTVEYSSLAVTVEGITPSSVTLKGDNAPVLTEGATTKVGNKTSILYSYEVLKTQTTDTEYEIWVDGEYTEVNVKYENPALVQYFTDTIEVNTVGYDASSVVYVELRDADNNRLFAKNNGDATSGKVNFSYTRFKDEREYSIYVDGNKANSFTVNGVEKSTIGFTDDITAKIEKIAYTTTIKTYLNGELAEIGTVTLGNTEDETYQLVRSMTGVYACIITHEIEGGTLPLYIDGRLVNEAQPIGQASTYNYYTIEYRHDERSNGILPTDRNIYLEGDAVTLLTGSNLSCGGKTFIGWSVNNGDTMQEGDTLSTSSAMVAIPIWKRTDFTTVSENFQLSLGASSFVYNGTIQTPNITVYRGKTALKEDRDYEVTYFNSNTSNGHDSENGESTNAINAGTITIKVNGINDYTGTLEATYWIGEKEISVGGLEAKNKVYDGTTTVSLTVDEAYLEGVIEGDDVYFNQDLTTGSAYTKMAGKHIPVSVSETKLEGAASSNYKLKSLATLYVDVYSKPLTEEMFILTEDDVVVDDYTYTYAHNEKLPKIIPLDMQPVDGVSKNILNDAFYEVNYSNNVHAGTAKITINADILTEAELATGELPNYSGTVELEYKINPRPITVRAKALSSVYNQPLASLENAYVIEPSDLPEDDLALLGFQATTSVAEGYYVNTYPNAVSVKYTENSDYIVSVYPADYTVTKTDTPIPFSVKGYSGVYDGQMHGIDLSVAKDDETAEIYYSLGTELDSSNYSSAGTLSSDGSVPDSVKVKNVGEYTIYFYIASSNYKENMGSANVKLSKATLNVTAKDHSLIYGDSVDTISGMYVYNPEALAETGYSAVESDVTIKGFVSKADAAAANGAVFGFISDGYKPGDSVLDEGKAYDLIPTLSAENLAAIEIFKNYDILFNYGNLYVEPKTVTFSWPVSEFTYSGSLIGVPVSIEGLLTKDEGYVEAVFDTDDNYKNCATNVGSYQAKVASLSGIASKNYKIAQNEDTASSSWRIVQATNAWTLAPYIQSWSLDAQEEYGIPYGAAKYGEVKYEYAPVTYETPEPETPPEEPVPVEIPKENLEYSSEVPTEAGDYYMKAYVEGTDGYEGLVTYVSFTISAASEEGSEKKVVYVTPDNITLTYGDSLPETIDFHYSFADPSDDVSHNDPRMRVNPDDIDADSAQYCTAYNPANAGTREVGTYVIGASGVTSEEYELIFKTATLTVVPREVTISWSDNKEFFFDNEEHGIYATVDSDSVLFNDEVTVSGYAEDEDFTNHSSLVGEYTAKVSSLGGNAAGNYKLPDKPKQKWEIKKATKESVEFTVAPKIANWYYGETAPTPVGESNIGEVTFKYQEVKEGIADWLIFNWRKNEIPTKPGTYSLTAVVDDGAGGTIKCDDTYEFTIYPANVVISAEDKSSVFGDTLSNLTYLVNVTKGSLTDDEINKVKNKVEITTVASATANVGTYDINVSAGNTDEANVETNKGQYTITPATITFDGDKLLNDVTVTYDSKPHTVSTSDITGKAKNKTTIYYSTEVLNKENFAGGSTEKPTMTDSGSKAIYFYAVAPNFNPISGSAVVTINKKDLTITAKNDSVCYGDSAPDYSEAANEHVTYSGFAGNDSETALSLSPSFAFGKENAGAWTAYTNESPAGEYLIRASLPELANYNVISVDGKLTVNKKNVEGTYSFDDLFALKEANVTVSDDTYVYDGTEKKPTVVLNGGLDVSVNFERDFEVSYSDNVNAGEATVTVSTKNGGSFTGSLSKTFVINKRAVTIKAADADGYYNSEISGLTYSVVSGSIVGGDAEKLKIKAETTARKNSSVGTYETTVEYKENTNYDFTVQKGTYTVKPASLTVASEGYSGTYDGEEHSGSVEVKTGKLLTHASVYYSTSVTLSKENYLIEGTQTLPKFTNVTRDPSEKVTAAKVFYYAVCDNFEPVSGSFDVLINPIEVGLSWTIDGEAKNSLSGDGADHIVKATVVGTLADGDSLSVTAYAADGEEPMTDSEGSGYSFTASTSCDEDLKPIAVEHSIIATVTGNNGSNYVVTKNSFNYIVEPVLGESDPAPQKAKNSIDTLTVPDWEYGDEHAPIRTFSKYGEVQYKYYLRAAEGAEETDLVPTNSDNSGATVEGGEPIFVGKYTVIASVSETDEYEAAKTKADFSIKKSQINIIVNDESGAFGDEVKGIADAFVTNKAPKAEDNVVLKAVTTVTNTSTIGDYPIGIEAVCEGDEFTSTDNKLENSKYGSNCK